MRPWRITLLISGLGVAALVTACHGGPHPTFVVDSGLDAPDAVPGDGTCDTGTGICTLRAAIDESNTLVGEDTATIELTVDVDLSIPGTLDNTNTTGDLDITHTVLINGQGHTIDAHQLDRVIDHHTGDLTITDTTITGGDATGQGTTGRGGGLNIRDGNTIITDTTITNNTSDKGGGGISHRNAGNLSIYSSAITHNSDLSISGAGGGGISVEGEWSSSGSITISYTTISNNSAGGEAGGLSVGWAGLLLIQDSLITNNSADAVGGIELAYVDATIERTTIADNSAEFLPAFTHTFGGELRLLDTLVTGNGAGGSIGVIAETDGFEILRTTIANNSSSGPVLAIQFHPPSFPNRPAGPGSIRQSTITGATTGALINTAASFAPDAVMTVGESVMQNSGGGPTCSSGTPFPYEELELTSLGHNWTSDNTCGLSQPTDIVGVDPMFGPLQDNGGPTHTMLPLAGSPLLNAITWNTPGACDASTPTDQRGLPRPAIAATNCDIGAAERQPTDP